MHFLTWEQVSTFFHSQFINNSGWAILVQLESLSNWLTVQWKFQREKINDVLIRVGEFIYPIDFIVLETQLVSNLKAQTQVILERPFLATANAIVNCRNGSMRLTFGYMTREINIFNLEKQSCDVKDKKFKVNLIENLISEHKEEQELETNWLRVRVWRL